jgi:hypothetical protein
MTSHMFHLVCMCVCSPSVKEGAKPTSIFLACDMEDYKNLSVELPPPPPQDNAFPAPLSSDSPHALAAKSNMTDLVARAPIEDIK